MPALAGRRRFTRSVFFKIHDPIVSSSHSMPSITAVPCSNDRAQIAARAVRIVVLRGEARTAVRADLPDLERPALMKEGINSHLPGWQTRRCAMGSEAYFDLDQVEVVWASRQHGHLRERLQRGRGHVFEGGRFWSTGHFGSLTSSLRNTAPEIAIRPRSVARRLVRADGEYKPSACRENSCLPVQRTGCLPGAAHDLETTARHPPSRVTARWRSHSSRG